MSAKLQIKFFLYKKVQIKFITYKKVQINFLYIVYYRSNPTGIVVLAGQIMCIKLRQKKVQINFFPGKKVQIKYSYFKKVQTVASADA